MSPQDTHLETVLVKQEGSKTIVRSESKDGDSQSKLNPKPSQKT